MCTTIVPPTGATSPAAASATRPADARLWKASREFQEVFMSQFVQTMRQSAQNSELVEEAAGRETFDQMFSEAIGRQMAAGASLSLQRNLYRQLGGTFETAPKTEAAGTLRHSVETPHVR